MILIPIGFLLLIILLFGYGPRNAWLTKWGGWILWPSFIAFIVSFRFI